MRTAGLEPARLTALPPQSSASANSAISARAVLHDTDFAKVASGFWLSSLADSEKSGEVSGDLTVALFSWAVPK